MRATTGFTSKISTALFTNDSRCTGVRMRFPEESSLDLPFFWSKPLRQPFPIFTGCQMAATTTRLRRIGHPFPAEECGPCLPELPQASASGSLAVGYFAVRRPRNGRITFLPLARRISTLRGPFDHVPSAPESHLFAVLQVCAVDHRDSRINASGWTQ